MKSYLINTVGVALIAVAIVSCSSEGPSDTQETARAISVKAEIARAQDVQVTRTFTGSLQGEKQAVLYAKIAEAVEQVNVREGQAVTANDVLIEFDKTGPSSNYLQSRSLLANAEKNFKKMEYLYKEGAVSESAFDAARTDYEVQQASFEAAAQLVDIRTPISGLVTSLDVSEGDFVQLGQKLATVATTSKLRVKFGVNRSDVVFFEKGSRVFIVADNVAAKADGEIVAVASSADPVTRSFEVEALVDNSAGLYKPGMFVRISIVLEDLNNVIAVPRKAVVTLDGKPTLFVVNGGQAEKRLVELGAEIDGHVVVSSGINVGDTVVTLGQDYLDEGFAVNIASLSEGAK